MRVVIADDAVLIRSGVAALLTAAGADVVGEAADPETLLGLVRDLQPDAAVVDIRMPPTHTDEGLRAAVEARRAWPAARIMVLSQYVEVSYADELLATGDGGVGYLLKDRVSDLDDFLGAVATVSAGGTVLDPLVVRQLMGRHRDPLVDLTPREREVLALMAEGRSNAAIGAALHVTEKAVAKHINSIFAKLDLPVDLEVNRRVQAVLAYLRL